MAETRACSPPAAGRPGIAPTSGIGPDPFGGQKFFKIFKNLK